MLKNSEAGLNHKINNVLVCLSDILLTYLRLNWVSLSPETTTLKFAFNIIIFYKFSSLFRWLTYSAFIKYFIMITVELICIAICCCCLFSFPTLCGLLSVAQFWKKKMKIQNLDGRKIFSLMWISSSISWRQHSKAAKILSINFRLTMTSFSKRRK